MIMKYIHLYLLLVLGIIPVEMKNLTITNDEKNFLLGKFDPSSNEKFSKAVFPYTSKEGIWLQTEVLQAFMKMHDAAKKDGITLQIISATRNFSRQKQIWENKWTGKTLVGGKNLKNSVPDPLERALTILRYSSMPGTSRHHWGTDIDINSVELSYFKTAKGIREYTWLCENASSFGFCQPYKNKGTDRQTGYEDEPWHWSYLPVSEKLTMQYQKYISYSDISGFLGCETAEEAKVIENFVLGIHPDCLPVEE
jgi:LAS superfamily LD-carboxypeptidase LdcB